ncbi:MAG: DUF3047 domain-containing protein [Oceanospirillaceae bacterium]|nr:DUF3047 domain-containing protein [Oceanospirillaceae bacterium]
MKDTKGFYKCLILASACTFVLFSTVATTAPLSAFNNWQQKDFKGANLYRYNHQDQVSMVRVDSDKTASGLFLEQQVDLNKTPFLNWSWKISNILQSVDERTKAGDDFAARVYVLTSTGFLPWQKHTLAYVWSNNQPIEQRWLNPYTDKVVMIAVDSGTDLVGTWQHHRRNVQQDLERAFGKKYHKIDVIAIMTDTDNSSQQATGWYKNFFFSAPILTTKAKP